MTLEDKIEKAKELFDPTMPYTEQKPAFYTAWHQVRAAYKERKLFEGTERIDPFDHPNNQADGNYE